MDITSVCGLVTAGQFSAWIKKKKKKKNTQTFISWGPHTNALLNTAVPSWAVNDFFIFLGLLPSLFGIQGHPTNRHYHSAWAELLD